MSHYLLSRIVKSPPYEGGDLEGVKAPSISSLPPSLPLRKGEEEKTWVT